MQEDYPTTKQWQKGKQKDPTSAIYVADVGQSSYLSFPPSFRSIG